MKNAEINRAIAESLGWKQYDAGPWYGKWYLPLDDGQTLDYEANFTDSLDACRLFEEKINPNDEIGYMEELSQYVEYFDPLTHTDLFKIATATPLQRCEAYLRMKRLWKEAV